MWTAIAILVSWFVICGLVNSADNRRIARADVDANRHREIMDVLEAIERK